MLLERWGATDAEVGGTVSGDELIPDAQASCTRSITVDGPPSALWPWLIQMGFGRAGWYSYDWIDNLGRRSADRIHPEWQDLEASGTIPGGRFVSRWLLGPGDGVMVRRQLLNLAERTRRAAVAG